MRLRELQNCQWATPADLEIFSQIGICLLFASDIIVFTYVLPCYQENIELIAYLC